MKKPLDGMNIVVTGASRGIGAALVEAIVDDGARAVIHCGRAANLCRAAILHFRQHGGGRNPEVAALVAFLSSDEAPYMCGSLIEITGAQAVA
jgi:NAD(P)-dependent dehydrogenase (short-subunit alcohol dehydrogenase family)